MEKNLKFLKWYFFWSAVWPMSSVIILYFQNITTSYASAMFVYSLCSLSQTFMALPSGIISDRFKRKHIISIASFSILLCFVIWAVAGIYSNIYLLGIGSILYGCQSALTAGTLEAFVFETVKDLSEDENQFARIYSRLNTYAQVGLGIASLFAAAFLYMFSLQALAWVCIVPAVLQFVLALYLKEPKRLYVRKNVSSFSSMLIALRRFRRSKKLSFFALVRVLESSVEITIHRFEAAYFKTLIDASLIAFIRVLKQTFGALGFYLFSFLPKMKPMKIYVFSVMTNTFFRLFAVLLNNVLTPFFMAFINLFYGSTTTASTTILQENFAPQQRATLHSLISLTTGFVVVLMMWALGFIADWLSPQLAVLVAVLFKIITVLCPLLLKGKLR